ncbi:unnamed protein product [Allacma fusca]|uniref:Uncharacterized protein n=1 Tax=Allacma fusca TaxID=39272 RepID=A0A8J2NMT2_9HEXA|nr:unnamed protein product [Allacma fusca]
MPGSQNSSQTSDRGQRADKRNQAKSTKFDLDEFVSKTNDRLKTLEDENASLKKQIEELKALHIAASNNKAYDQQSVRRNNILITGLKEIGENTTSEDAKTVVTDFLRDKLKLTESMQFNCELIIPKKKGINGNGYFLPTAAMAVACTVIMANYAEDLTKVAVRLSISWRYVK